MIETSRDAFVPKPYNPLTSKLAPVNLSGTEIEIKGISLTAFEPGRIDVSFKSKRHIIDVNIAYASVFEVGIGSDKSASVLSLNNATQYFPPDIDVTLRGINAKEPMVFGLDTHIAEKWSDETELNRPFDIDSDLYVPDSFSGMLARKALVHLKSMKATTNPVDLMLIEAASLGVTGHWLASRVALEKEGSPARSNWQKDHDERRLSRAVEYAMEHLDDPALRIADMAAECGISSCHFSSIFKKHYGIGPYSFVLSERLDRAQQMVLSTDHSLAEVAYSLGFASQSHMTTAFKKKFGVSPGKIRHTS